MTLDTRGKISVVQIICYIPVIIIAIILVSRHGKQKKTGWIFLLTFSAGKFPYSWHIMLLHDKCSAHNRRWPDRIHRKYNEPEQVNRNYSLYTRRCRCVTTPFLDNQLRRWRVSLCSYIALFDTDDRSISAVMDLTLDPCQTPNCPRSFIWASSVVLLSSPLVGKNQPVQTPARPTLAQSFARRAL